MDVTLILKPLIMRGLDEPQQGKPDSDVYRFSLKDIVAERRG
ncbi:MAG: hypothetical protein ACOCQG_01665 [Candidatus Nanoarchaeia archaeon]